MKKNLMLWMAALAFTACGGAPETAQNAENASAEPTFKEVLTTRRSVRDYDASKTISEAEVRELLAAVQEAPSWANLQSTRYYVALSPEKLAAAKEAVGFNKKNVEGAPVMIVSTFVKHQSGFHGDQAIDTIGDGWGCYDNGVSNAYLVLQARAMGFDTLIMGMREPEKLREIFGIPESEEVMAVISLGYRASEPNRPERKSQDEVVKIF